MYGTAIKVSLNSPPVDGKANAALCAFLADLLNLPKTAVSIRSGHASRSKVVEASGISADRAVDLLQAELP